MKKNNFLLLGLLILLNLSSQAQTFKLHADYLTDWYGPGIVLTPDIPGYPSVTLQADTIGDKFVIEADNSYNKWKNQGSDPLTYLNVPDTFVFIPNAGNVADNMLSVPTITGQYYTTRLHNLNYQSTRAVVMKTTLAPAGILSVSQSPTGNPNSGTPVALSITTGTRSPEEHFYVRYSTNNFSTSEVAEFVFQGPGSTSGIASIPSGSAGTNTSYYIFSSTVVLQNGTNNVDYDLITLRQNNNQNQNYSFTTVNPVTTAAITFRVNMSSETLSAQGVRLTGSFFNWSLDSAQTMMTSVGNGIFEKTVSIDTTLTVQYKFINGGNFLQQENVPQACGIDNGVGGFDRQIAVPNVSTSLPIVCFSSCTNCPAPPLVPVTFRVNMSQQTVSPQGVRLTGSFFNWSLDSALTIMSPAGNGVYEKTVLIDSTTTVQYKFVNGSTFAQQETVPQACGINNGVGGFDRQIVVPEGPTFVLTVCFGACDNCPFLVPVTFRVNMSLQTPSPQGVRLTGSFVNWTLDSAQTIMNPVGNGVFEKTVSLDTTLVVQYKFINGAIFAAEETVPSACGVANNVSSFDRQIAVPNTASVLPTVCFGSCTNCPSAVFVPVTFRVDMSETPAGPDGVRLAGSFNNWTLGDSSLMVPTGNGIFEKTLLLDTSLSVQYKFVNGLSFQVQESVPQTCGVPDGFQGFNRILPVPNVATTLPAVCYSSCAACLTVGSKVSALSAVKLFPNPAAKELFLQNLAGVQQIEVFNSSGQKVFASQPESTDILSIPVSGFASGVYLVRITSGSDVSWQKFSKQ